MRGAGGKERAGGESGGGARGQCGECGETGAETRREFHGGEGDAVERRRRPLPGPCRGGCEARYLLRSLGHWFFAPRGRVPWIGRKQQATEKNRAKTSKAPGAVFSPADRRLAEAVHGMNGPNPFLPERIAAERAALGADFQEHEAEWNMRPPTATASFPAFRAEAEKLFALPGLGERIGPQPAPQRLASACQIRRAVHTIFRSRVGGSAPMGRLRAAIRQSLFTHDLGRDRRGRHARRGISPG